MAPAYYFGFYYIIKWKNYQTLGREVKKLDTEQALKVVNSSLNKKTTQVLYNKRLENILLGLGGQENIIEINNCATRLRVKVKDMNKVENAILAETQENVSGIIKKGSVVQVIYGTEVVNIKNDLLNFMNQ